MSEKQKSEKEGIELPRIHLGSEEQELVTKKLAAVIEYRQAKLNLTKVNLELVRRGFVPDLGAACW